MDCLVLQTYHIHKAVKTSNKLLLLQHYKENSTYIYANIIFIDV